MQEVQLIAFHRFYFSFFDHFHVSLFVSLREIRYCILKDFSEDEINIKKDGRFSGLLQLFGNINDLFQYSRFSFMRSLWDEYFCSHSVADSIDEANII